jgi:methionine synthase I (cobalamin-dependent)
MNNLPNIFSITRRIGRPLILDGAMGSILEAKFKTDNTFALTMLNVLASGNIYNIHQDYIKAGADIITTNTFRTNPEAFEKNIYSMSGLYCKEAVNNAMFASRNTPVIIAGSNAPAEDCYQRKRTISKKALIKNHTYHIDALVKNGVHLVLNETFSHRDEIKIVCEYCSRKNIPFIISLYFNENLKILSGEKVEHIIKIVQKYNPLAIGFNCIKKEHFLNLSKTIDFTFNWGVYLNCGAGKVTDKKLVCEISPAEYAGFVKKILKKKPSFVGACCGSSPAHIKQIKKMLDGRNYN